MNRQTLSVSLPPMLDPYHEVVRRKDGAALQA